MTIYAVDDKKLPLEALAEAIRQAEPTAEIHCFRSGVEALEALAENPCDVAFIDIEMPEINGVELAKQLKLAQPRINIVFATGYSEYTGDAISLHCSGYLMKPITPEKVRRELDDLRYPVAPRNRKRVTFQTFGNFEVFIDGQPLQFQYEKTKEFLAYLVDRGTLVSNREIAAALWERDVSDSYIRLLRKDLFDTFRAAGCADVLLQQRRHQGVCMDRVSCDYYDWKLGVPQALDAYRGEYMTQYSWAEFTHGAIERET